MSIPLIHPPWRQMAEEILKAEDPELYQMFSPRELAMHLDLKAETARQVYPGLVERNQARNPGSTGTWAMKAAEEMIVRDVLDPTSSRVPGCTA
ncbi:MAG: hypothetical protein WD533_00415 [Dehalococcoidia bacterium]